VSANDQARRLAERLIRHAVRWLPEPERTERYREWTAEVPAILTDPDVRPALRRLFRALLYAADQHRTAYALRATFPRHRAGVAGSSSVLVAALVAAVAVVAVAAPRDFGSATLLAVATSVCGTYVLIILESARRRPRAAREPVDRSEANLE